MSIKNGHSLCSKQNRQVVPFNQDYFLLFLRGQVLIVIFVECKGIQKIGNNIDIKQLLYTSTSLFTQNKKDR